MTQVEISMTLRALVEELVDSVYNTKELVEKVERQAEEEKISPKHLRELIVEVGQKRKLSERQIYRLLPASTKDKKYNGAGKRQEIKEKFEKNEDDMMSPSTEPYRGDAGNDPELVEKYTEEPEGATAQWAKQAQQEVKLDVKKWWAVIEAHMPTKTLIFVVEDGEVVDVRGA